MGRISTSTSMVVLVAFFRKYRVAGDQTRPARLKVPWLDQDSDGRRTICGQMIDADLPATMPQQQIDQASQHKQHGRGFRHTNAVTFEPCP